MAKIKVLYQKMPPKSRTGKSPSGVCFDYKWGHIAKMIQEAREKGQRDGFSLSVFKPGEAEITTVYVGDDYVTFFLEPKDR